MHETGLKTLSLKAGQGLVLIAVVFNMALCLMSTRFGIHTSNTTVAATELMILATGLYFCRHQISAPVIRIAGLFACYLVGMKLINAALDLKIIHDIGIMLIFYQLGMLATIRDGNRLLWAVMVIVISVAAFEVLLPLEFGATFDVWNYYVDKGVITASTINYSHTTSFISGSRGGQLVRSFFPSILGPERFSSVFLEPVSMGNFSVITFAWCLSMRMVDWRLQSLLAACAACCMILADSRFGAACFILMLLFRITPLHRSRLMIFCLPLLTMLALLLNGSLHQLPDVVPAIINDNFSGRLLFSGQLLDYWRFGQWFALAPSQVYTSDTGYAYAINNLSLPLALCLLGGFAFHTPRTAEGLSMKAMITVYMAASLCIGANMFSIKTAALCWFLYGAASSIAGLRRTAQPLKNISQIPLLRHQVASLSPD